MFVVQQTVTEEKFSILFQSQFSVGGGELVFQVWVSVGIVFFSRHSMNNDDSDSNISNNIAANSCHHDVRLLSSTVTLCLSVGTVFAAVMNLAISNRVVSTERCFRSPLSTVLFVSTGKYRLLVLDIDKLQRRHEINVCFIFRLLVALICWFALWLVLDGQWLTWTLCLYMHDHISIQL